jgi:hypothetical protein
MSLTPGQHRARAVKAELGFTQTGKEQIAITFELLDLPGQRITYYGMFITEILGKAKRSQCDQTMEAMRNCGWKTDDVTDPQGISDNEVELVIDTDTNQRGESRLRVKWVNSPTAGSALKTVMPAAQKGAFAAKMKAAALASRAKMPAPSANGQSRPANAGDAWEPKDEDAPNW